MFLVLGVRLKGVIKWSNMFIIDEFPRPDIHPEEYRVSESVNRGVERAQAFTKKSR